MEMLTRAGILAYSDIAQEVVEVPEWGGFLYVRGLTGTERDSFEQSIMNSTAKGKERKIENLRAQLVVRAACNEDGTPIFNAGDVKNLGNKSAAALDRVYGAAAKLSGLSAEDAEELVEDFSETQSESST